MPKVTARLAVSHKDFTSPDGADPRPTLASIANFFTEGLNEASTEGVKPVVVPGSKQTPGWYGIEATFGVEAPDAQVAEERAKQLLETFFPGLENEMQAEAFFRSVSVR